MDKKNKGQGSWSQIAAGTSLPSTLEPSAKPKMSYAMASGRNNLKNNRSRKPEEEEASLQPLPNKFDLQSSSAYIAPNGMESMLSADSRHRSSDNRDSKKPSYRSTFLQPTNQSSVEEKNRAFGKTRNKNRSDSIRESNSAFETSGPSNRNRFSSVTSASHKGKEKRAPPHPRQRGFSTRHGSTARDRGSYAGLHDRTRATYPRVEFVEKQNYKIQELLEMIPEELSKPAWTEDIVLFEGIEIDGTAGASVSVCKKLLDKNELLLDNDEDIGKARTRNQSAMSGRDDNQRNIGNASEGTKWRNRNEDPSGGALENEGQLGEEASNEVGDVDNSFSFADMAAQTKAFDADRLKSDDHTENIIEKENEDSGKAQLHTDVELPSFFQPDGAQGLENNNVFGALEADIERPPEEEVLADKNEGVLASDMDTFGDMNVGSKASQHLSPDADIGLESNLEKNQENLKVEDEEEDDGFFESILNEESPVRRELRPSGVNMMPNDPSIRPGVAPRQYMPRRYDSGYSANDMSTRSSYMRERELQDMSIGRVQAPAVSARVARMGYKYTPGFWYYKDPSGKLHGPFDSKQMKEWLEGGFFTHSLEITRNTPQGPFYRLGEVFPVPGCEFLTAVEDVYQRRETYDRSRYLSQGSQGRLPQGRYGMEGPSSLHDPTQRLERGMRDPRDYSIQELEYMKQMAKRRNEIRAEEQSRYYNRASDFAPRQVSRQDEFPGYVDQQAESREALFRSRKLYENENNVHSEAQMKSSSPAPVFSLSYNEQEERNFYQEKFEGNVQQQLPRDTARAERGNMGHEASHDQEKAGEIRQGTKRETADPMSVSLKKLLGVRTGSVSPGVEPTPAKNTVVAPVEEEKKGTSGLMSEERPQEDSNPENTNKSEDEKKGKPAGNPWKKQPSAVTNTKSLKEIQMEEQQRHKISANNPGKAGSQNQGKTSWSNVAAVQAPSQTRNAAAPQRYNQSAAAHPHARKQEQGYANGTVYTSLYNWFLRSLSATGFNGDPQHLFRALIQAEPNKVLAIMVRVFGASERTKTFAEKFVDNRGRALASANDDSARAFAASRAQG